MIKILQWNCKTHVLEISATVYAKNFQYRSLNSNQIFFPVHVYTFHSLILYYRSWRRADVIRVDVRSLLIDEPRLFPQIVWRVDRPGSDGNHSMTRDNELTYVRFIFSVPHRCGLSSACRSYRRRIAFLLTSERVTRTPEARSFEHDFFYFRGESSSSFALRLFHIGLPYFYSRHVKRPRMFSRKRIPLRFIDVL